MVLCGISRAFPGEAPHRLLALHVKDSTSNVCLRRDLAIKVRVKKKSMDKLYEFPCGSYYPG